MGGKKGKGKKGKKGKKGGAFGDDYLPDEKNHVLYAQLDSLNSKMADIEQQAEAARAAENEKRMKDLDNEKQEKDQIRDTNQILSDLTRQYKATKEDLAFQDSLLTQASTSNESLIIDLIKKRDELQKVKDVTSEEKETEIKRLRTQQIQMKEDFENMLKETLDKMRVRIQAANDQWAIENSKTAASFMTETPAQ